MRETIEFPNRGGRMKTPKVLYVVLDEAGNPQVVLRSAGRAKEALLGKDERFEKYVLAPKKVEPVSKRKKGK